MKNATRALWSLLISGKFVDFAVKVRTLHTKKIAVIFIENLIIILFQTIFKIILH